MQPAHLLRHHLWTSNLDVKVLDATFHDLFRARDASQSFYVGNLSSASDSIYKYMGYINSPSRALCRAKAMGELLLRVKQGLNSARPSKTDAPAYCAV